ncbi:MAG: hypothetical protein Q7R33_04915 [Nitrosarchaeum sp.]|nr:hypothetical protein [Nitrosarchaeum sp.]
MKHLAQIQSEFLNRVARTWDDLSLEEQKAYLGRHPKSNRRLTAKPEQTSVPSNEQPLNDKKNLDKKDVTQELADEKPAEVVSPVETKPSQSMSKKEIAKLLEDNLSIDNLKYSDKKGGFVFKRSYFYRHGMDSNKFAQGMIQRTQKLGLTPKLVDSHDNWNAWPKDSWFEAVISFEQMKSADKKPVDTDLQKRVEELKQPI